MNDLISRQAANEALSKHAESVKEAIVEEDHFFVDVLTDGMKRAIRNILSAPQWTPCSEGLPKEGEEVFVYLFERQEPYIAWVEANRWYTEDFEIERENEPVAWMPLPEPYKGEADE